MRITTNQAAVIMRAAAMDPYAELEGGGVVHVDIDRDEIICLSIRTGSHIWQRYERYVASDGTITRWDTDDASGGIMREADLSPLFGKSEGVVY